MRPASSPRVTRAAAFYIEVNMHPLRPSAPLAAAVMLALVSVPASAAPPAAAPAPAAAAKPPANPNPVIATVNGEEIRLADVRQAAQGLPDDMRNYPPQMLFPMVVNQLIDQKALVAEARAEKLPDDPRVQELMRQAENTALQNALLSRVVGPQITDDKLHAAYDAQYATQKGEEEVHARHILVPTEAQARDVIRQLKHGADFATLAKKVSTDKASAGANGGDLGWFKKGDMLPDFSKAAFGMKKGEVSTDPVHTTYGWHVIQVLDTRVAPPPAFDTVKDQIRQGLIQAAVRAEVKQAMGRVTVVHYNPDGTVMKPQAVAGKAGVPGGAAAVPAPPTPAPGTTTPSND
jgi:peptidyl-prolyl cis-trans isomerase C